MKNILIGLILILSIFAHSTNAHTVCSEFLKADLWPPKLGQKEIENIIQDRRRFSDRVKGLVAAKMSGLETIPELESSFQGLALDVSLEDYGTDFGLLIQIFGPPAGFANRLDDEKIFEDLLRDEGLFIKYRANPSSPEFIEMRLMRNPHIGMLENYLYTLQGRPGKVVLRSRYEADMNTEVLSMLREIKAKGRFVSPTTRATYSVANIEFFRVYDADLDADKFH